MKKQQQQRVRFVRIHGRVVPIRMDKKDVAAGAAGAVGAGVAADAARTTTIYKSKRMQVDRKKFSFLPMSSLEDKRPRLGTQLIAKSGKGERMGRILYSVDKKEAEGSIDWLSVKRKFRGKGVSKKLAKHAAADMYEQGGREIFSHVVHKRSAALLEGEKGVRSKFFRAYRTNKDGTAFLEQIGKREALKKAGQWKGKPGKFKLADVPYAAKELITRPFTKQKYDYSGPTIFRQVKLPKVKKLKPFRTLKNKLSLGIGAAVAVASAGYLLGRNRK